MKKLIALMLAMVLLLSLFPATADAATNTKSGTAADVVAVATAQKNGSSGKKYINWYWSDGQHHQWCAAFVSWCAAQAGASKAVPKNGGCTQMYKDVKKAGGKAVSKPQPGDLVFYHKKSVAAGNYCHVGIVTKVSGSTVYSVQGNLDNRVYNPIKVTSYQIGGSKPYAYTIHYLRPNYNGTQSDSSTTKPEDTTVTIPLLEGSTVNVINRASGRTLDVYGDSSSSTKGSNVHVYTLNTESKSSQFKFTKTSGGWFSITPRSNTGLALNPYSDTPKNGTNVNVYTKDTSDKTQGWIVEESGPYYIIRSAYNKSLVLTAEGTSNMSNVKIATYSEGNKLQQWALRLPDGTDVALEAPPVSTEPDPTEPTNPTEPTDPTDPVPNDPEPADNSFADVEDAAYFAEAVRWAVENGITNGTGEDTFSPDKVCTRGQVVTFLWRAVGSPEPVGTTNIFTDVDSNAYYYTAVLWAVEQGITTGTGKGKFSPDNACTRAQVATFLWRTMGKPTAENRENTFADVAADAYFYEAVLWAVEQSITNGTGKGKFSPDSTCTRGQIVTFLYRTAM